jgi:hypothetical protein
MFDFESGHPVCICNYMTIYSLLEAILFDNLYSVYYKFTQLIFILPFILKVCECNLVDLNFKLAKIFYFEDMY